MFQTLRNFKRKVNRWTLTINAGAIIYPANIYFFKVISRNTRKRYELCSKLTIKTSIWCFYCQFWTYFTSYTIISNNKTNTSVSWAVLFQRVGAKTYLQCFFQVTKTCHTGTTTHVFLMFKIECSWGIFSFK